MHIMPKNYRIVRQAYDNFVNAMLLEIPDCMDRKAALTAARTALMWANASLTQHEADQDAYRALEDDRRRCKRCAEHDRTYACLRVELGADKCK